MAFYCRGGVRLCVCATIVSNRAIRLCVCATSVSNCSILLSLSAPCVTKDYEIIRNIGVILNYGEEPKLRKKTLFQCHFVFHSTHMDCPGNAVGPPR